MGEPPCDVLQAEIALDRIEAELAQELPAHMRAFARAHADGRPPPPAPLQLRRESTLAAARAACAHPVLADRGIALLRLVAPILIEDHPGVAGARAAPRVWPSFVTLAAAREVVARMKFGCGAIELMHRLHGVAASVTPGPGEDDPLGPPIDGWRARDAALDDDAIREAWTAIAGRVGVSGLLRIERSATAHPRAFVIEPKLEVIVVVPSAIDTPAARFAVLHELGHAIVGLGFPAGTPRVVDEAVASCIARLAEPPSWLPMCWQSELAIAARRRRTALAAMLDRIERGLPAPSEMRGARPPWALWNDPGAQAAYVEAEAIADRFARESGGQLLHALEAERDRIDHAARV